MPAPPPNWINESQYRWNESAQRYIDKRGRFVKRSAVVAEMDTMLKGISERMVGLADQLREEAINLAEFQTQMMNLDKSAHLIAAAIQRGGWAQMTQSDYGRVGQIVRVEYGFIRNLAEQIKSGVQKLNGSLRRRVRLYAKRARNTYYRFQQGSMRRRGFEQVASVRSPVDSCEDCIRLDGVWFTWDETRKGYYRGDEQYIRIGDRQCLSNCACHEMYRNLTTDEVIVT